MTSLDKKVVAAGIKFTAELGSITGRPDLPPLTFRMFDVMVRKHHRGFRCDLILSPESRTIKEEKMDLSITDEEETMLAKFMQAMKPVLSPIQSSSSARLSSAYSSSVPSSSALSSFTGKNSAEFTFPSPSSSSSIPSTSGESGPGNHRKMKKRNMTTSDNPMKK